MDMLNTLPMSQSALDVAKTRQIEALGKRQQVSKNEQAIDKAAKDFEEVFLAQMLAPMMEQAKTDPPFGGGFSEDMYRSLLVDEYAKLVSESGGIGVASEIKRELMRMQEVAQ